MPVRSRRQARDGAHRAAGVYRRGLARVRARAGSGTALRLSRARSLRAGGRASLQSAQAAGRPLRAPPARRRAVEPGALRLRRERRPRCGLGVQRCRQRAVHAQVRGHRRRRNAQVAVRLAPPRLEGAGVERHGDLRGPRQGPDAAESARAASASAAHLPALGNPHVIDHLVKLGVTSLELMPVQAFCDDSYLVDKGLRNYWGYYAAVVLRPGKSLPRRRRAERDPHGRHAVCTMPGSRSFSTSSTITRPRAIISARHCRFAASTTPPTTSWPTIRASISTPRAAATR